MRKGFEEQLSEISAAWQALTGEVLVGWHTAAPVDLPAKLCELVEQMDAPLKHINYEGKTWLAARSLRAAEPFYFVSPDGNDASAHWMEILVGLLDSLSEEQNASQQLSRELLSAWNRLNFLFDIARIATQDSDQPAMFTRLARSLLQVISAEDVCLVLVEGEQIQVYTASGEPLDSLERLAPFASQSEPLLILQRGRNLPDALAEDMANLRTLILLPIPIVDQLRGLLGLINYPNAELGAGDRELLLSAVEQIGMLLDATTTRAEREASHRLDHELTIASQIQESLLPTSLPTVPGLEFAASLKPAYLIGGDFYDVQPVEDGLAIVVGDVAGKGIPAAMLTAMIHATLKGEAQYYHQPAELLRSINRLIYDELDRSDTFITTFLAVLQTNPLRFSYASAGHTTTLLWRSAEKNVEQLHSTGMPLGVTRDVEIVQRQMPLNLGDVLVLYSDGITEAENDRGRVFGAQALIDLLLAAHPASVDKQLKIIMQALDLHRGELPLRDDVVLFMARADQPQPARTLVVPFVYTAEKASVRELAILTRNVAAQLDFPSVSRRIEFLNELELAVSEIATNVVVHAYWDHPYLGRIQGRLTVETDRVKVDLIDHGRSFEPDLDYTEDEALPGYSLVDPPVSGYGLIIARRLLDVCQYGQLPGGRNHWYLEKILT